MPRSARDILGPNGPLSRSLPGHESRDAQLRMADGVQRAIESERVLLCEAGTGTGKTLAYLVPAILSGRKVVVSTATKALQEQIFFKDLPLLAKHAGLHVDATLVKGLSNYLCLRRYNDLRSSAEAERPSVKHTLGLVDRWVKETETGDLAELVSLPESDPVRLEISSSSETRIGQGCPYYEKCFVTQMKRAAEQSRLLVVNHHLLFADLALRGTHPASVLPPYEAVILDEAHQIDDIATDFFGTKVSSARVEGFLRDSLRAFVGSGQGDRLFSHGDAPGLISSARLAADLFFTRVAAMCPPDMGRQQLPDEAWTPGMRDAYHKLDAALEAVGKLAESRQSSEALEIVARRGQQIRDDLAVVVDGARRHVGWVEVASRSVSLGISPVDVAGLLRTRLFEATPSVVLTSATLATASGFSFVRARVGLSGDDMPIDELQLPSPFDYKKSALLYTPRDLPEVQDPTFVDIAAERIAHMVAAAQGGAFVLCTSVRAMRALHTRLRDDHMIRPLLVQGEAPKSALLQRFRASGNAVLVATMGFWEGVDVPGHALRLVVIDKAPFPVPSDPVIAARSIALEEAGLNPFLLLQVPVAAIALKQGFGRLIRTMSDRGVVAILDRRLVTRGYGTQLVNALPPARRTQKLEDVERFFESIRAELAS